MTTEEEYRNLYIKTLYVIISCTKLSQLKAANKYLTLAVKELGSRHRDMLLTQALVHEQKLKGNVAE